MDFQPHPGIPRIGDPVPPNPPQPNQAPVSGQAGPTDPHLLSSLFQKYSRARPAAFRASEPHLQIFLLFCEEYLRQNRPVQVTAVNQNYRVQLANGIACLLAPAVPDAPGQVEPDTSVPITHGGTNEQDPFYGR